MKNTVLQNVSSYKSRKKEYLKIQYFIYYVGIVGLRLYTGDYVQPINLIWEIGFPAIDMTRHIIKAILHKIYGTKKHDLFRDKTNSVGILSQEYGKFLVEFYLNKLYCYKKLIYDCLLFSNIDKTVIVDVLFISQKGVFVIKSINDYAVLKGVKGAEFWVKETEGKKLPCPNPMFQNKVSIEAVRKALIKYGYGNVPVYSIVAFGDCDLVLKGHLDEDTAICNYHQLPKTIKKLSRNATGQLKLRKHDLDTILAMFNNLNIKNEEQIRKHIIQEKLYREEMELFD